MQITGWDLAVVVAKTLSYAATLSAAGSVFFLCYGNPLLSVAQQTLIRFWIASLSLLAVVSSVVKLMLLAGSMSGVAADMIEPSFNLMILRAGEGWSIGMRLVGLSIACAALLLKPRGRLFAGSGATLAAVSFALTGHVHAVPEHTLLTLVLMLHLFCVAFWLGALMPLYRTAGEGDFERCAALAARFGNMAAWVIALLLAAAAVLLWQLLDSPSSLWKTEYGRLVSVKIVLVGALLGCAALNKWRLVPGLLAHSPRAAGHLRRSIVVEMLLASMTLVVTAVFTTLLGPKS